MRGGHRTPEEADVPATRDPTWLENEPWRVKTLSYFSKNPFERMSIAADEITFERMSIKVDEIDDESEKRPRKWAPIKEPALPATAEAGLSRQAYQRRGWLEWKAMRKRPLKAKTIAIQTEQLTTAEKAVIARRTGRIEALPISEATDDELADFCTKNRVRLAVPPGLYDDEKDYPAPWVVECIVRSGGRPKGKQGKKVQIDTAYVGYTGDLRRVKPDDDPTKNEKLVRQLFDVSRQPTTRSAEVTIRELIAKGKPDAITLHDLMENNYDEFAGRAPRKKGKNGADSQQTETSPDAGISKATTQGVDTQGLR